MLAQADNYPAGSSVSDFTVTDTDGNTHNLYTYTSQGKHVVLDFFFAACGPCQFWQPTFSELHELYGCNEGDLITISINNGDDNDAEVIAYEQTYGGSFAHAPAVSNQGGGEDVTTDFGVGAFPTFVLIDPSNVMVNNDIWPLTDINTFIDAFPQGSNIQQMACVVGIDEQSVASFTDAFPIPTSGTITLNIEAVTSTQLTVEVFDVLGQQVLTEAFGVITSGGSTNTMDLSSLSDGQYIMKLMAENEVADVKRIILAR